MASKNVQDSSASVSQEGKSGGPTICHMIAPYTIYSIEQIYHDLRGCILHLYSMYKHHAPDYTVDMAKSDAYIGILNAINYCKQTVSDKDGFAVSAMTGEPVYRTVIEDGKPVKVRFRKSKFSTLVFTYIRGAIQQGMKQHRANLPSLDRILAGEDLTMGQMLSNDQKVELGRRRKAHELPDYQRSLIHEAIRTALSPNERRVVVHVFGIDLSDNPSPNLDSVVDDPSDSDFVVSNDPPASQTTAAQALNVSKQRICVLVQKALGKLKEHLKAKPELSE